MLLSLTQAACSPFASEWSLATGFEATDEFMKKWADSQKLNYGKGAGWIVSCVVAIECAQSDTLGYHSSGTSRSSQQLRRLVHGAPSPLLRRG